MNGCKKCPAYAKCTETYRGSGCAALRWTYGLDSDPKLDSTDREKLLSLIQKAKDECARDYSDHTENEYIADTLLDNGVTFATDTNDGGKWMPVTDRLPEHDTDVLCWYEYFRFGNYNRMYQTYGIGYCINGNWGGEVARGTKCRVLAWMPLPEPPKEE